jgi:hypothetical protein
MLKTIHYGVLICAGVLSLSARADVENGKTLHQEHCTGCHMMADHSALYTREDRKVDSLQRLGGQVSACTQALDIAWFPEDEKDVVDYLNTTYYHFEP